MTRADIQLQLQLPYDRDRWLKLLKALLPGTEVFGVAQALTQTDFKATSAAQIARIPLADGRIVAVLEVQVAGQVDLQRNRVGLRNLVAKFIDQHNAHAVLGFFRSDRSGDGDYRMSFVARSSEISADGQLSRTETDKRRYTYILGRGQPCRTPAERLELLRKRDGQVTLENLVEAFKVEPLFKEFFRDYGRVFDEVEALIKPSLADKEMLRLFTQRLFNRLMFLAFIERKGWLKIGERTDYLAGLWDTYADRNETGGSFYANHLVPLFFEGLNQPDRQAGHTDPRFGAVPYLNGGLFEKAEDGSDDRAEIVVPDKALESIFDELFARYNFTVAESTPLDVEVAVDPEMLGKVFEELVTGRHEQGSYYTPKPIVSFMCREALVEFLTTRCPKEKRSALEEFVHDHKPAALADAEAVLAALRAVTVCDPACGSGAYLLGMLHELLDLRTCLFAASQKLDAPTAHERKLEIIERNLYGVDLDSFAVNIARLRLWLSLAVEYEGTVPPPLPNLDFKIEQGDALAAPAPQDLFQRPAVVELQDKKAKFLRSHGEHKQKLWQEIEKAQADLAVWQHAEGTSHGFNWGVEFAEVFLGQTATTTLGGDLNLGHELAATPQRGGFDIIVANPPYVRMELIKPQKPVLRKRFPLVHAERADLYIYFYARAQELLRSGGVAAFISSNKWLRSGYGESLRQHLLDAQNFRLVMDFGELGVFDTAATDAAIFLWQKKPRAEAVTRWAMVKDLQGCYAEGVRQHFLRLAVDVPAENFGEGKPRLMSEVKVNLHEKLRSSGIPLGQFLGKPAMMGIKTGLNDAFVIDEETRTKLVNANPGNAEIIKPFLSGDDIRHYELHFRWQYLIYTVHGINMKPYPEILAHLRPYREQLEKRATQQEWYELQQPQAAYQTYFESPKIIYGQIMMEPRFHLDADYFFTNQKCYFLPTGDWFVLAFLNSKIVWDYLKSISVGFGDPDAGGRLEPRIDHIASIPIPDASAADRKTIGELAKKVQTLHGQRRTRVERFLRDLGLDPAQSTSRNPLEQPWNLSAAEFAKRAKRQPVKLYETARDETAALTEQIAKLESEIDTRVATLYGLDAEDQRWAAQASPSAKSDDKQSLFFGVLGRLKERRPYFRLDEIQTAANDAELALKDSSLKVYLSEAVKQGHIHDAGRGWYSSLATEFKLDTKPVAPLVRLLEKKFPLLDFHCWATAQINPYMHHLLGKTVTFVNTDGDAMEAVADFLRGEDYNVHLNPRGSATEKFAVRTKTVVVRKRVLTAPVEKHFSKIETVLVGICCWKRSGSA